ncbi:hypothetical protein [uncultured Streptomyces sp.]|uniref:hypothetical protein n=1 Tax=uncultured Streptomyces sp. TaxID=174707 RepID=UPI00260BDB07|nr:hypothetical protein [uncultured Streptomyces sp.]
MSADAAAVKAGEEWPAGTFGGPRSLRGPGDPDPAVADRVQTLAKALDGWRTGTRPELAARAAAADRELAARAAKTGHPPVPPAR